MTDTCKTWGRQGQPVWIDPVYDDAGNTTLTPQPSAPASGFTLVYDAWNFPVEVKTSGGSPKTVAKYAHNGLRHRIRKEVYDSAGALSSTVLYFNNLGWQCLESRETPVAGSPATTTYVWGVRYIDDLVCRDRGGTRLYAMQDRQYKTMAIANASGVVQERYGYTPYGVTTVYSPTYSVRSGSSFDWTYLYTGRELDWETNLYHFRNRMYDPVLGRFISRDPIGYRDGFSLYKSYFAPNLTDPNGTSIAALPAVWGAAVAEPSPLGEVAAIGITAYEVGAIAGAVVSAALVRRCFCHERHPGYQRCSWLDKAQSPVEALKSSAAKVAGWSGPHVQKIRNLGQANVCPGGSPGIRYAAEAIYYYQDTVSGKFITYTIDYPVNCCACCNVFTVGVSCRQIHPTRGSGNVPLPPAR